MYNYVETMVTAEQDFPVTQPLPMGAMGWK